MSPEAMRVAIGEARGIKLVQASDGWWDIERNGEIERKGCHRSVLIQGLPDCPNDLNAMHEAEKVLTDFQWQAYVTALIAKMPNGVGRDSDTRHATAAQRAEAFLKATGKWQSHPPAHPTGHTEGEG